MKSKDLITQAKKIVIKIGSSLLLDSQGNIQKDWLKTIVDDIKAWQARGQEIILVCSGSVALGKKQLSKKSKKSLSLPEQQAAAAIGQVQLAHAYQEVLASVGLVGAQLLLSLEVSDDRKRYLNASNTLNTLLSLGVVPIINENDSTATAELSVGDNDRLAARVAQMAGAEILIFFFDVDGLFTDNPSINPRAKHIPLVEKIDPSIERLAKDASSGLGTGGMLTKITAAKIATQSGCHLVILKGEENNPLKRLEDGALCTWFVAKNSPASARKKWLAHQLKPKGELVLDEGAVQALVTGKNLLASGVVSVVGKFQEGDVVKVCSKEQKIVAIGLCNYPSRDIEKLIGRHSQEIESILGYTRGASVIHSDNLVLKER